MRVNIILIQCNSKQLRPSINSVFNKTNEETTFISMTTSPRLFFKKKKKKNLLKNKNYYKKKKCQMTLLQHCLFWLSICASENKHTQIRS